MKNILFILLLILVVPLSAQTVKDLEQQRKATLQQLETTKRLLNETKQSEKSTLTKLSILSRDISTRRRLISSINTEIHALDRELVDLTNKKQELSTKLEQAKMDYTRLIRETYYTQSTQNALLFVLSADSFNKMMRRLRYLNEFSNYRKEQAQEIELLQIEIEQKNKQLNLNRQNKHKVLGVRKREQDNLARNERKEKAMLGELQKKEKQLLVQQKEQQAKANKINDQIEKMIAEEIRRSQQKEKNKQQTASASQQQADEKKAIVLTGNFEKNKGRLPWPTNNGFISGKYGLQPHAVLKHITINNKGIYIQTSNASNAYAVFDGEVTRCFSVQGGASAVIIRHGNYRTVYANLAKIYVKEGDVVELGEKIGQITRDEQNDNKTELYFQVWKDRTILNPSEWIMRK